MRPHRRNWTERTYTNLIHAPERAAGGDALDRATGGTRELSSRGPAETRFESRTSGHDHARPSETKMAVGDPITF